MKTAVSEQSPIRHLAIIMDGNRRWARERGLSVVEGHQHGYEALQRVADWCIKRQIKTLTVYAFSTENWKRSEAEVSFLFSLFSEVLTTKLNELFDRGVRLSVAGRIHEFSATLRQHIQDAQERTAANSALRLVLALNYGGRAEIVDAVKSIVANKPNAEEITEEYFSRFLYVPDVPDPDLIIRTSGEERLSGFLLWQSNYAELYFMKKNWPAVTAEDMDIALTEYQKRKRRFGAG